MVTISPHILLLCRKELLDRARTIVDQAAFSKVKTPPNILPLYCNVVRNVVVVKKAGKKPTRY